MDIEVVQANRVSVSKDDVVIIKFPFKEYGVETAQHCYNALKLCWPDNPCVIIPNECDITVYSNENTSELEPGTQEELAVFLGIKNREGREQNE